MESILEKQCVLSENLAEINDPDEINERLIEYITSLEKERVILKDFGDDLEWLNASENLSLHKNFKGKVVVLDFFTYCCINCLHMLPVLHKLEEKYSANEEVIVIGVHSAKFDNERTSVNVAQAILKYDISHVVVNDPKAILWDRYNIHCWPTLIILGPDLQILFVLVGESEKEKLLHYTDLVVKYFGSRKQILNDKKIPLKLLKDSAKDSLLSYPGKVAYETENQLILISDSGHNRIIIATKEGVVKDIIGGPEKGFKDGSYKEVRFSNPQGIASYQGNCLFIADTGNHAIRKINLAEKTVKTIIGNGSQGEDFEGGRLGPQQVISSPWDLCLGPAIGSDKTILYIAMAGTHQIWGYSLEKYSVKSKVYPKHTCFAIAGSGNEENRNNCYPRKASFAQPSGLTFAKTEMSPEQFNPFLYIADSESSAVRSISLLDGSVKSVVGGDRNPTNLFAYGDVDGKFYDAKLQHPMGVCFCPKRNLIYVADTFNHKIKKINPVTKECSSLNIEGLNEPCGLFLYEDDLYIANSNSHCVVIYNVETEQLKKLPLYLSQLEGEDVVDASNSADQTTMKKPDSVTFSLEHTLGPLEVNSGTFRLHIDINLHENLAFTEGAPHFWSLTASEDFANCQKGQFSGSSETKQCEVNVMIKDTAMLDSRYDLNVKARVFVCEKETGVCMIRETGWLLKLLMVNKAECENEITCLKWTIEK